MAKSKKIVVYGGAFNPPTLAHYNLAISVLKSINADKLIFMPVGDYYNKKELIHSQHRTSMLEILCANHEELSVSYIEVNSDVNLNTIETLDILKKEYSNDELYFLMGSDNLKELSSWTRWSEILERHNILVMPRECDSIEDIISKSLELIPYKDKIVEATNISRLFISSTMVRNAISNNNSTSDMISNEIKDYITKYSLYI